ncbi:Uncharacterised protein [Mycobacteroides abscessus subsp. abscessus]|nr:Uncharacterised protein [Mycobacteroides abscessus subsp. abscessus]
MGHRHEHLSLDDRDGRLRQGGGVIGNLRGFRVPRTGHAGAGDTVPHITSGGDDAGDLPNLVD